jgi:hypothetical protein
MRVFSAVLGAFEGGKGQGGRRGGLAQRPAIFVGFPASPPEEAGLVLKLRARPWQASKAPARAAQKAGLFVWLWLETKHEEQVARQDYECIMCIANRRNVLCMFPCGRIQC